LAERRSKRIINKGNKSKKKEESKSLNKEEIIPVFDK